MDERLAGGSAGLAAATGSPALTWQQSPPVAQAPAHAGFWRRFLASLIDSILLNFVLSPLSLITSLVVEPFVEPGETTADLVRALVVWSAAFLVMCLALNWLYFAIFEASSWQATLGKRALGMVVTDLRGNRISFGRASGRFLASAVSGIILGLGYLIQPFTARRQALHDIISGTLVVRT